MRSSRRYRTMMSKKNTEAIELSRHISTFIGQYAPSHLTNSPNTLRSYETALTLYIAYLETKCGVTPDKFSKECFDQKHIEGWLAWLVDERKCGIKTRNNRLSSLRAFTQYLSSRDIKYLTVNTDAHAVSYKKAVKKKVAGLSRDAVKAILGAPDANSHYGLRDVTLMTVLYGTAARIDELLSIKISDLYLDAPKPYIIITGKGEVTRTLYLLPRAVEYLNLYLKVFHGARPESNVYLFFSPIQGKEKKLSQVAVFKLLRKYAAVAHEKCKDVPLDLHAHQFRHAKATHWLEDGMNIVQISFLLGHASVETTMVYLDITTEKEYEALATLEGEKQRNVKPKWNRETDTLSSICGLRTLKT